MNRFVEFNALEKLKDAAVLWHLLNTITERTFHNMNFFVEM